MAVEYAGSGQNVTRPCGSAGPAHAATSSFTRFSLPHHRLRTATPTYQCLSQADRGRGTCNLIVLSAHGRQALRRTEHVSRCHGTDAPPHRHKTQSAFARSHVLHSISTTRHGRSNMGILVAPR